MQRLGQQPASKVSAGAASCIPDAWRRNSGGSGHLSKEIQGAACVELLCPWTSAPREEVVVLPAELLACSSPFQPQDRLHVAGICWF